jgi:hypothetical protein
VQLPGNRCSGLLGASVDNTDRNSRLFFVLAVGQTEAAQSFAQLQSVNQTSADTTPHGSNRVACKNLSEALVGDRCCNATPFLTAANSVFGKSSTPRGKNLWMPSFG